MLSTQVDKAEDERATIGDSTHTSPILENPNLPKSHTTNIIYPNYPTTS